MRVHHHYTERNKIDAVTKSQLSSFLMELVTFTDQHKSNSEFFGPHDGKDSLF